MFAYARTLRDDISEDGDEEDANNQNLTTPPDLHDRERPPENAPRVSFKSGTRSNVHSIME